MTNAKCYLCNNTTAIQRPGSVRDKTELDILECDNCGLVFLSSFDHISLKHYQESGMHDKKKPNINNTIYRIGVVISIVIGR